MKLIPATEWLLYYLWMDNPNAKFDFNHLKVPNTTIFSFGVPNYHYWTEGSCLLRYDKDRISNALLLDLYVKPKKNKEASLLSIKPCYDEQKMIQTVFLEHFAKENVEDELLKYSENKMIQDFVHPYMNRNRTKQYIFINR